MHKMPYHRYSKHITTIINKIRTIRMYLPKLFSQATTSDQVAFALRKDGAEGESTRRCA